MDLVGALNRVFEKVLGVKTADSKKLLDDYIGGGGGGGDCKVVFADALENAETHSLTIDKTAAELIELIASGKYIIVTVENSEDESLFLPLLSHVVEDGHASFYFLNLNGMILRAEFYATGLNEKPVYSDGGR